MSANIRLVIVTPEKVVVDEEARIVMAPGTVGEFGILTGHTPFLTSLKTGGLRFVDADGHERLVFISGGFAEALPDKVTVLAETAERRREIDIARAKAAYERAMQRVEQPAMNLDTLDILRAKAAMLRALERIKIVEGHPR
jgi:F-type H+-transporting ATPase subunit epsilon